uniref:Zinc metalloproteinase n=1 Tax=Strongyloides venezuelensis TaxID=75913 RepID=A0A0K0F1K7_STRVS
MKNKSIIFLYIFLSVIVVSTKNLVSKDEEKDLKITEETNEILEKIVKKVLNIGDKSIENTLQDNNKTNTGIINQTRLFQGDIVLNPSQAKDIIDQVVEKVESEGIDVSEYTGNTKIRNKRKMEANMSLIWEFPIPYIVEEGVNDTLVMIALKLMELETCIRFQRQATLIPKAGLRYYRDVGCFSHVGRKLLNTFQDISIGDGCETIGTIQHETMHALGSYHEQSREDRDNYLKVFLNNVKKDSEYNFIKVNLSSSLTYNTRYDYGSEMQYPTNAFSINEQPTMLPVEPFYEKTLGVDGGLSFVDVKLLNYHYCIKICPLPIVCFNDGYQDPNNCAKCKCVNGYTGDYCDQLPPKLSHCGDTLYEISHRKKYLYIYGGKNCIHHLKGKSNKKLKITITVLNYYPTFKNRCKLDNSLEIKYLEDKTVTGALFCLNDNATIFSRNDHVIVHHRSTSTNNGATLEIESIEDSNKTDTIKK